MTRSASTLAPHPRLFVTPNAIGHIRDRKRLALLNTVQRGIARLAKEYATRTTVAYPRKHHNAHLLRARTMQGEIFALLAQYLATDEKKYRDNVVKRVRAMGKWEYWSWIKWREGDPRPNSIFDLSYGENSVTIGLAYDLLYNALTPAERKMFQDIARRRSLVPFLKHAAKNVWWLNNAHCNWNTVCAGGAGVLALAMYEDIPEAREVVQRAEKSFKPYMHYLNKVDGGWEEGVGYWNFGMAYAFMYLLSHENATGKRHPLLRQTATRKTLRFPLDFAPNSAAAGFGDANAWTPLPIHMAVAERLNDPDTVSTLLALFEKQLSTARRIGRHTAELLFFYPHKKRRLPAHAKSNVVKLYKNLDWGLLADHMPSPRLYCSVRGGDADVVHGHTNVSSFNVVVRDEAMILPPHGTYMDSTFSARRFDIFELGPQAKNMVLVNGVGVLTNSCVKTKTMKLKHGPAIRIDATEAMGSSRQGFVAVDFLGRLFTMFDDKAILVIDRVEAPHVAVIESRVHTPAAVTLKGDGALLTGKRQNLSVAYGSTVPASVFTATDPVSQPVDGHTSTMVRWVSDECEKVATFATLLVPGKRSASVSVVEKAGKIHVRAKAGKWSGSLTVSTKLNRI